VPLQLLIVACLQEKFDTPSQTAIHDFFQILGQYKVRHFVTSSHSEDVKNTILCLSVCICEVFTTVRKHMGRDTDAACGQVVAKTQPKIYPSQPRQLALKSFDAALGKKGGKLKLIEQPDLAVYATGGAGELCGSGSQGPVDIEDLLGTHGKLGLTATEKEMKGARAQDSHKAGAASGGRRAPQAIVQAATAHQPNFSVMNNSSNSNHPNRAEIESSVAFTVSATPKRSLSILSEAFPACNNISDDTDTAFLSGPASPAAAAKHYEYFPSLQPAYRREVAWVY
jgi:hypothetical protein